MTAREVFTILLLTSVTPPLTARAQEFKAKHPIGVYVVDVQVNGTPRRFLVDTGASVSLVSRDVCPACQVQDVDQTLAFAGGVAQMKEMRVSLAIGTEKFWAPMCLMDMTALDSALATHIDGVLGQDILSHFDRVTFNYKEKTVEFR